MPKGGMVVMDLGSGAAVRVANVKSFQVAETGKSVVAYLREAQKEKTPDKSSSDKTDEKRPQSSAPEPSAAEPAAAEPTAGEPGEKSAVAVSMVQAASGARTLDAR